MTIIPNTEKAMAPHSSTLAWNIPWMEEQSMGSLRVGHDLSDFTFTFHFHALEKEMAAHSSVLAWRIPGTGEPGGLLSMGSHRVGHDWSDLAAAAGDICRNGVYNIWVISIFEALILTIHQSLLEMPLQLERKEHFSPWASLLPTLPEWDRGCFGAVSKK